MTVKEHQDAAMNVVRLQEIRRCVLSTLGGMEAICDDMAEGPNGFVLRAMIEGGMPELVSLVDDAIAAAGGPSRDDDEACAKSFARGYQVVCLSRFEEETGKRDPAAWRQDPDEFMAELGESDHA